MVERIRGEEGFWEGGFFGRRGGGREGVLFFSVVFAFLFCFSRVLLFFNGFHRFFRVSRVVQGFRGVRL